MYQRIHGRLMSNQAIVAQKSFSISPLSSISFTHLFSNKFNTKKHKSILFGQEQSVKNMAEIS